MTQEQKPFEIKTEFERLSKLVEDLMIQDSQPAWTPIESVEQVEGLVPGYYLLELDSGEVLCATGRRRDWRTLSNQGEKGTWAITAVVNRFKAYKLIHAFEKPEKKYYSAGGVYTLKEASELPGTGAVPELARDLLSAQARIRELENK